MQQIQGLQMLMHQQISTESVISYQEIFLSHSEDTSVYFYL